MIEKPLIIIICCYIASFGMFGIQYTVGDLIGVDLVGVGSDDKMIDRLNSLTTNNTGSSFEDLSNSTNQIIDLNETDVTTNPISEAARVAWLLFQVITGTYIFQILTFFGIPEIFVAGISMVYVIMLARTIIAYLRGI